MGVPLVLRLLFKFKTLNGSAAINGMKKCLPRQVKRKIHSRSLAQVMPILRECKNMVLPMLAMCSNEQVPAKQQLVLLQVP